MLTPLSTTEISARLQDLKDWEYTDNAIQREWVFKDFKAAMAFINSIARLAASQDHHPEIFNSYNRVRLRLNTHAVKSITSHDFLLAKKIDQIK